MRFVLNRFILQLQPLPALEDVDLPAHEPSDEDDGEGSDEEFVTARGPRVGDEPLATPITDS